MEQIDADELKQKLDHGDEFKLVMTLGQLAFRGKHIAGSLEMHDPDTLLNELDPEDEIVVYCSDKLCPASMMASTCWPTAAISMCDASQAVLRNGRLPVTRWKVSLRSLSRPRVLIALPIDIYPAPRRIMNCHPL